MDLEVVGSSPTSHPKVLRHNVWQDFFYNLDMERVSKSRLKALAAFRRQVVCDEGGVFVVEGVKMCEEAMHSGFSIECICAVEEWWNDHGSVSEIPETECYEINKDELERISSMVKPNKVWMLLRRRQVSLAHRQPLTIALDHIQDPGNMGTIMRTADWFGLRHIVCSTDTVSCYNAKVVQSTMGAVFRTRVDYVDLHAWLNENSASGVTVYGAAVDGDNVFKTDFVSPAVVVLGNESKGLSAEISECVTHRIAIPNVGGTCESLNVASAAAILCAEFSSRHFSR